MLMSVETLPLGYSDVQAVEIRLDLFLVNLMDSISESIALVASAIHSAAIVW